jgi:hypothetical protein
MLIVKNARILAVALAACLAGMALAAQGDSVAVESICKQVAPPHLDGKWERKPNQTHAVLLIRGLQVHLFEKDVPKAELQSWQKPDCPLVKELGKSTDVFVFAYGQNASIETIIEKSKLADSIARIRKLGYTDVTLIGHSAGGLIARHFVEDNPDAGVTKVVQVCAPNGGSSMASLGVLTAPKNQKPFMDCLTVDHRRKCLEARADKLIPAKVQFVCVVAKLENDSVGDGVVKCNCQWTPELQKQGVPVELVMGGHLEIVRDARYAETLARVVRQKQERWPAKRIEKARAEIFGTPTNSR